MGLLANDDGVAERRPRWRVLIIALAICGLSVSLATRTFRPKVPQGATVTSNSAQPMRQHLNRDAMQWVAPIPVFSLLEAPSFLLPVTSRAPLLLSVFFDESLSNRPPPSC
jgi:hypothetical protein